MSHPAEPSVDPSAPKPRPAALAVLAITVVLVALGVAVAWFVFPGSLGGLGKSHDAALTGDRVRQALLDGDELTAMLDQPFKLAPVSPVYGGFEAMDNSSPPSDCLGVVDVGQQSAYQSADVQSYARETWPAATPDRAGGNPLNTKVMFVKEAVIALPSAADAQALFAKFTERWRSCDGRAVAHQPPAAGADGPPQFPGAEMHIADVRATGDMLTASIVLDKNPKAPDARAVGVRNNCIVGVLVAFTGTEKAVGSADPATTSSDVARAMMAKVSKLS